MKKLLLFALLLSLGCVGRATSFEFTPSDRDIGDLEHQYAYLWKINAAGVVTELQSGMVITSASIFFDNITNWDSKDNRLFVDLLNNPTPASPAWTYISTGLWRKTDNAADNTISDYFQTATGPAAVWTGPAIQIGSWKDTNGPGTTDDLTMTFGDSAITALQANLLDGPTPGWQFGLGFDPDCHFYNCGVRLTITTAPRHVPDGGATLGLLVLGLLGIPGLKRLLRA